MGCQPLPTRASFRSTPSISHRQAESMDQEDIAQYEFDIRVGEAKNADTPAEELATSILSGMTAKERKALLVMILTRDIELARVARLKEEARLQNQRSVAAGRAAAIKEANERDAQEHAHDPWNAKGKLRQQFEDQPDDVKARQRAADDEEFAKFLASRPPAASPPRSGFLGCDEFYFWKKVQAQKDFEAKIRHKVKLELTKELLATQFVGRKGTRISWGNATVEDHLAHMEVLLRQAGDSVVVAKKHAVAVELLAKHQVGSLNEVNSITTKKHAA